MKKLIIIPTLLICALAYGQEKPHLPKEVMVKLSDAQIVQLSMKIDSVNMLLQNSSYPAGQINPFVARFQRTLEPFWIQVQKQMVVDPVKKGGGNK